MSEKAASFSDPYISLVTYRKSGAEVATPVWVAEHNGLGYVFSAKNAGKVKRLRNNSEVKYASCDMRGKLMGPWSAGTGTLVTDQAEIDAMYEAFTAKYGWQMRITNFMSRLSGRYYQRDVIAIKPES